MLRLAALLLGNRSEAEEVVQEAFLVVPEKWREIENPGGYLRMSVINGSNQLLRWRQTAARHPLPRAEDLTTQIPETIELLDALRSLSDQQRQAIVLRYYLGLSDQEIARYLSCRPSRSGHISVGACDSSERNARDRHHRTTTCPGPPGCG